jgi:transcriptional regulator with XRE-family HTH domain
MTTSKKREMEAVHFGGILRRFRMQRGWTLSDLADESGMNATYLGVLERGGNVPSLQTLFYMADIFGVEAAEIVREMDKLRREEHRLEQTVQQAKRARRTAANPPTTAT